jgi:hypothetical protein
VIEKDSFCTTKEREGGRKTMDDDGVLSGLCVVVCTHYVVSFH